jgi:hypothetical protein
MSGASKRLTRWLAVLSVTAMSVLVFAVGAATPDWIFKV